MLKHCVEIMFGNKGEGCCRHVFLVHYIRSFNLEKDITF